MDNSPPTTNTVPSEIESGTRAIDRDPWIDQLHAYQTALNAQRWDTVTTLLGLPNACDVDTSFFTD